MKKIFTTFIVLLCSAVAFAENPFILNYETVQYNKISMNSNGNSSGMDGVTVGIDIFFNIKDNWYAEFFPNAQVGWRMPSYVFCSLKSSLGLSYKIPINDDGGIAIYPTAGFDIGAYAVGTSAFSGYKVDWFKDLNYQRFILNWHTGAALTIKKVIFFIRYEGYIVPLSNQNGEKLGLNQWSFGIGFGW